MPALVLTKTGSAGGFGLWRAGLHPALRVTVSDNSEPKAMKLKPSGLQQRQVIYARSVTASATFVQLVLFS